MTDSLGQWPSAPLAYVLAEVRCSPTLDLARRAAAIQELIQEDFPLLEPIAEFQMPVAMGIGPSPTGSAMYAFSDSTKRRGVVITAGSLCYHATEYETSKEFFEQLGRVLTMVEPVYARDTVTRLGLRYVDAIVPRHGESVFDYLNPAITGISLDGDSQRRVQCVIEQPRANGGITVRLLALGVPIYRSPDLPALGLRVPRWIERAMERQAPAAVLDTDNWVSDPRPFDAKSILGAFRNLKNLISSAFLKVTTSHAVSVWQSPRQDA
jgi:uncharacterized protein (TIGR04255 family)